MNIFIKYKNFLGMFYWGQAKLFDCRTGETKIVTLHLFAGVLYTLLGNKKTRF
jgi:hypothetical protein